MKMQYLGVALGLVTALIGGAGKAQAQWNTGFLSGADLTVPKIVSALSLEQAFNATSSGPKTSGTIEATATMSKMWIGSGPAPTQVYARHSFLVSLPMSASISDPQGPVSGIGSVTVNGRKYFTRAYYNYYTHQSMIELDLPSTASPVAPQEGYFNTLTKIVNGAERVFADVGFPVSLRNDADTASNYRPINGTIYCYGIADASAGQSTLKTTGIAISATP